MTEKMIRDAYCRIRTIDQTIPDEVLDFMRDASIEKLNQALRIHDVVGRSEQLVCDRPKIKWKTTLPCYKCDGKGCYKCK